MIMMIREFNFVPLENQGQIKESCKQFPVGSLYCFTYILYNNYNLDTYIHVFVSVHV